MAANPHRIAPDVADEKIVEEDTDKINRQHRSKGQPDVLATQQQRPLNGTEHIAHEKYTHP